MNKEGIIRDYMSPNEGGEPAPEQPETEGPAHPPRYSSGPAPSELADLAKQAEGYADNGWTTRPLARKRLGVVETGPEIEQQILDKDKAHRASLRRASAEEPPPRAVPSRNRLGAGGKLDADEAANGQAAWRNPSEPYQPPTPEQREAARKAREELSGGDQAA